MVPTVICKGHGAASKRQLFDLCDATDAGEVRAPSPPAQRRALTYPAAARIDLAPAVLQDV